MWITNGFTLAHWNDPESRYYEQANIVLNYVIKNAVEACVVVNRLPFRKYALETINLLVNKNCKVTIKCVFSDIASVETYISLTKKYGDNQKVRFIVALRDEENSFIINYAFNRFSELYNLMPDE